MTFGYDAVFSKIWKANNVLDIYDFGKQLAHELWCHYADDGDVYIPFKHTECAGGDNICGSQYGRPCRETGDILFSWDLTVGHHHRA